MKQRTFRLADGDKGIDQTITEMWRLALRDATDPVIRSTVRSFPQDKRVAARAAFEYVVRSMPYVRDPGRGLWFNGRWVRVGPDQELVIAPRYTLGGVVIGGDCDDMATALVALLTALDIECAFKTIAWYRNDFTHVYVVMRDPVTGGVIPLDPVRGLTGYDWELRPIIRAKIYEASMADRTLVTLEDGPTVRGACGCGGSGLAGCGCRRRRGDGIGNDTNRNVININIPFAQQGSNTVMPAPAPVVIEPVTQRPVVMPITTIPTPAPMPHLVAPRQVMQAPTQARTHTRVPAFLGPPKRRYTAFVAS